MAGHGIEFHAQVVHITAGVVGFQDGVSDGAAACIGLGNARGGFGLQGAVDKVHALGVQFHDGYSLRFQMIRRGGGFINILCFSRCDAVKAWFLYTVTYYNIPALRRVVNAVFYAESGKATISLIK